MKLATAKSEIDNNEDQLRQKDIKYSQAIKVSVSALRDSTVLSKNDKWPILKYNTILNTNIISLVIQANDEQHTKMLSMMNKHSQEHEALRQQKNHIEQLYEDQKHLLHKTKQENSSQPINIIPAIIANYIFFCRIKE